MSRGEGAKRTSPRVKAKGIAALLEPERPDYNYLREIFRHLRRLLDVKVVRAPKKTPYVPTEEDIKNYYEAVWKGENIRHLLVIKTFLYTGVRVGEIVGIRLEDVDLAKCQIKVRGGVGGEDRIVPFPQSFKVALAVHMEGMRKRKASHLFVSSWGRPYSERGIRKVMETYTRRAGLERPISPHKLRRFLLAWMRGRGIDDALIQPYSGLASAKSLKAYPGTDGATDVRRGYDEAIKAFPV